MFFIPIEREAPKYKQEKEIHDSIKSVLPSCKNPAGLKLNLERFGIEIEYKLKRTTSEIEGVSFRYGDIAFKGSEVDKKFSFGNLKKEFQKNVLEGNKRAEERYLRQHAEQTRKQEAEEKAQATKRNIVIKGLELSDEQQEALMNGGHIFLENMTSRDGKTQFSAYAFLNEEKNRVFFSNENSDELVKYGKCEMRIRDKILIENGYVTKAKVKWYGGMNFAYPYLWKTNKSDPDYQESWGDPRIKKDEKPENRQRQIPKNPKRGKKI